MIFHIVLNLSFRLANPRMSFQKKYFKNTIFLNKSKWMFATLFFIKIDFYAFMIVIETCVDRYFLDGLDFNLLIFRIFPKHFKACLES